MTVAGEAAPARTPSGGGVGLPSPAARLVGREREIGEAAALLREDGLRLLTLTGPGGVGKTRLALEVARRAEPDFADGARLVPLASIADPALVESAVGRALGFGEEGERPLLDRMVAALCEHQALLVIDNFEHVLDAAPLVGRLLEGCPDIKVLATSRAPLHLSGEREHEVPPLELPDPGGDLAADEVARSDAVALFVDRACAASPEFELTDAIAPAVAEVCRRLDGVPLAIELAAARAKLLSPEEMLERLRRPFDLLTGGPADMPLRQRTLRATIEWSHSLLDPREQRLFARLSVFAGGCTLAAAEEVGGRGGTGDVLRDITALVDRSLVSRSRDERGEVRLRMLETIREFGLERLSESGEEEEVRRAHADCYLAHAEWLAPQLLGGDEARVLELLETDHDNLRAAVRHLLDRGDAEGALRFGAALWRFWLVRGFVSEGRRLLSAALEAGGSVGSRARAGSLAGAGYLAHYQNEYALAEELFAHALALSRKLRDGRGTVTALAGLATVVGRHSDPQAARSMYEEALATARRMGDSGEVASLLERLGTVLWYQGDLDAARPLLEESLASAAELGLPRQLATAQQALGWLALSDQEPARATGMLEQSAAGLRELGDRWSSARAAFGLGHAAMLANSPAAARARFGEALRMVRELGDTLVTCGCLGGIAAVAAASGRPERAVLLLAAAERERLALDARHSAFVQDRHEAVLASARQALGDRAFEAVHARGAQLPLERALAEAELELAEHEPNAWPAGLTAREVEVLRHVAAGLTDAEIAAELVVSVRTVNAHLRSVYRKIDVGSRSAATRFALDEGLAGG